METVLSTEQTEQFHKDGYLVFERFFTESETAALKADMDALMRDRARAKEDGSRVPYVCEYPALGALISDPRTMQILEQIMGTGFAFHHLHAVRQEAGTPGVNWHQDYEQEPTTNRAHVMAHVFYYLNGLNGEVGDLLVLPGSHRSVVGHGALECLRTHDLPGSRTFDRLPPGSAVVVHSALWHARRAKPGGEGVPRYFADASYCQAGVRWPSYGLPEWREILAACRAKGLDRGGQYAHLFDEAHFFDIREARQALKGRTGSLVLELAPRPEAPHAR